MIFADKCPNFTSTYHVCLNACLSIDCVLLVGKCLCLRAVAVSRRCPPPWPDNDGLWQFVTRIWRGEDWGQHSEVRGDWRLASMMQRIQGGVMFSDQQTLQTLQTCRWWQIHHSVEVYNLREKVCFVSAFDREFEGNFSPPAQIIIPKCLGWGWKLLGICTRRLPGSARPGLEMRWR